MGLVLGWMATRVLGQYDLLLAEGEDTGGVVSYVGPNVVALERRHNFPAKQFRLWIALHEVTHRCQFTGVPWLRPHFLSLVDEAMSGVAPDPRRFADALRRAAAAVRAGKNPLEEAGMLGLVAPPEQLEVIDRIQAMMSLLEGHGDITMDRAGHDAVPDAEMFARVLRERRRRASLPSRLLQQLVGIEAKMRQYEAGEQFIRAVEASGDRSCSTGCGRAPRCSPPWTRSAIPRRGWRVSDRRDSPPGDGRPRGPRRHRRRAPRRLHLPPSGGPRSPVRCRAAPIPWRCWPWPPQPDVR